MAKHTIELSEKNVTIINVVKSVIGKKSIDEAVSFIVEQYGKSENYVKFIDKKRKEIRK